MRRIKDYACTLICAIRVVAYVTRPKAISKVRNTVQYRPPLDTSKPQPSATYNKVTGVPSRDRFLKTSKTRVEIIDISERICYL